MLNADTYMTVNRQHLSQLTPLPEGWKITIPYTLGVCFDFYMSRWLDDITQATGPDAKPFRMKFQGKTVMLFSEVTPKTGKFLVNIDGKPAISQDSKDGTYSPPENLGGNMHYVKVLATGLDPSVPHTLEIVPQLVHVPAAAAPSKEKEYDQVLRIESILVAGAPATVERAD
jgi:hypothetical protein